MSKPPAGLLHCLPGKINIYTGHYLCIYEVAVQPRSRPSSHATEIILARMPEEESAGSGTQLSLGMKRSAWLDGRTAGRLANRPGQPVSHSELWMYSVEAIDTIVLWRGGWRGIKNQQ